LYRFPLHITGQIESAELHFHFDDTIPFAAIAIPGNIEENAPGFSPWIRAAGIEANV
jgi:hypothetical protein